MLMYQVQHLKVTMIVKLQKSEIVPESGVEKLCLMMDTNEEETVPVFHNHSDEIMAKWGFRTKRHVKRKITLLYLLKVVCASRETCLEWLKNRGLIPRIMFCPNCSRKMKFEANDLAIDGYIWICKECTIDPPQFSSRHGSWLESKDAPLVDILLFTYLWSHGFTEDQISKETNMSSNVIQEWNVVYTSICDALFQRSLMEEEDLGDGNNLEINRESSVTLWRRKNVYKDPFLEFLKDADSL